MDLWSFIPDGYPTLGCRYAGQHADLGGWRDPSNVRRVWRQVRDELAMDGLVTHTLRKTVASFLDDAQVSTRKISDQLGHSRVSMTQDRYLGRRPTDRQTAEVLESMLGPEEK